ncbi:MAG: ribosome maturation factor RimM [Erysipelotrichaceae bacterium]|nr:ribosome maturation factor RimM [Erysipelotrichaceae bacterium]
METILIGGIANTFGLKGELKIKSFTDFADDRFRPGNKLYIEQNGEYRAVIVQTFRYHKDMVLVSFRNMQDINLVEQFKGCQIYIDKKDIPPLPEGEFYFHELKGLDVVDTDLNPIGKVINVEETGANNVLRVLTEDRREVLIPYVPAFIRKVDMTRHHIVVQVIEGLL